MQLYINKTLILIDDEDLPIFQKYSWYLVRGYVYRNTKGLRQKTTTFHREIIRHHYKINPYEIDHANGNRGDNRKINLRICNGTQNLFNRAKYDMKSLSRYKGVALNKPNNKWYTRIQFKGVGYHLLTSYNEHECAYAYNVGAELLAKEFAYFNKIKEEITKEQQERIKKKVENALREKGLI